MVTAIDEELVFSASGNRLEYFRSAIDWGQRLQVKQKHLTGAVGVNGFGQELDRVGP